MSANGTSWELPLTWLNCARNHTPLVHNGVMKINALVIPLAFTCALTQLSAQDPLRVGIDVKEPQLVKKVEITYPEEAKIARIDYPNVLQLLIDEQGNVAQIKTLLYERLTIDSTIAAVKQWRFAPTYVNGKVVSVTATLIVIFALYRTPSFLLFHEKSALATEWARAYTGNGVPPRIARMNRNGDLQPITATTSNERWDFVTIPEHLVPFSVVEEKMKARSPEFCRLLSGEYRYPDSSIFVHAVPGLMRLYYSVLLTRNPSQLVQLAGADPLVQPPDIQLDFDKLSKQVPRNGYPSGTAFYTVFVDEKGAVLGLESSLIQDDEALDLLSKATVIKPGMRDAIPVPTAVIVAVPIE